MNIFFSGIKVYINFCYGLRYAVLTSVLVFIVTSGFSLLFQNNTKTKNLRLVYGLAFLFSAGSIILAVVYSYGMLHSPINMLINH